MVSLKLPVCVSGVPPGSELKHIGGEQPGAGKLVPVNSLPFVAAECDLAKQRARAGNFAFSTLTSKVDFRLVISTRGSTLS